MRHPRLLSMRAVPALLAVSASLAAIPAPAFSATAQAPVAAASATKAQVVKKQKRRPAATEDGASKPGGLTPHPTPGGQGTAPKKPT